MHILKYRYIEMEISKYREIWKYEYIEITEYENIEMFKFRTGFRTKDFRDSVIPGLCIGT